ncbi:MAG: extracellular solute-binding protein [Lachnospiraceae bacterium]|nr:extracellular solute-binding protein [Lachnospiraceae bacterium]
MISCVLRWLKALVLSGRLLPAFFLLVFPLLFDGCGAAEASPMAEDSRDCIWRFTDVPLASSVEESEGRMDGGGRAEAVFLSGDRICTVVSRYGDMGEEFVLFSCDTDGENVTEIPLAADGGVFPDPEAEGGEANFTRFCAADGNLYALEQIHVFDEETGQDKNSFALVCMTSEGEVRARHELAAPADLAPDDYYYIDNMLPIGEGKLLFKDTRGLFTVDTESGAQRRVYQTENDYFDGTVSVLRGNKALLGVWEKNGYIYRRIDTEAGKLADDVELPDDVNSSVIYPGLSRDGFYYAGRAVWAFDLGRGKRDKVIDFVASDLLVDDVRGLAELPDGRIAMITMVWANERQQPSLLIGTHIPPSEVKDREEITISGVWLNRTIMSRAVAFNQENEDYRIRIVDYSQYQSDNDWSYPYTKLNTDIVSGYIPDILIIDDMMPVESYINKGILRDLTPLLAEDEELSRTAFLDNIFDAYRIDGKLYELIPSFTVTTGVMRASLVNGRKTLTMQDLRQICGEQGIDIKNSFGQMTRDTLMSMLLYVQGMEYVDLKTGKCAFDSPAFIDLLELAKTFPVKENDDYESGQTAYREGRAALMLYGISDFKDYPRLRYGYFGDEISMIGIPGGEGSSTVIQPQMQIAITTSAKHPEAVWSFVREFLSEQEQDAVQWGFPVRIDSLEKKAEKAKERPYYFDETGKKVEYDESWWIGGQEIPMPAISDEEIAMMQEFLGGCDRRVFNNSTVSNIINEEAAAFFEGVKSAEEVAKIIQSRAQIYVHENR